MATKSRLGYPQQTVMWYVREGEDLLMTSLESRTKVRHISRDSQTSILIAGPGCYVSFQGRTTIEREIEVANRYLKILIERYVPPESVRAMEQKLLDPSRVLLRFSPHYFHSHGVKAWTQRRREG